MGCILAKRNDKLSLELIFAHEEENSNIYYFDGTEFLICKKEAIPNSKDFNEIEYSKGKFQKKLLEVVEIRKDKFRSFYVQLKNGDIVWIHVIGIGHGEPYRTITITNQKSWKKSLLGKQNQYEQLIKEQFAKAEICELD